MKSYLTEMGKSIIFFDYGQPWIYYYILNTITNLNAELSQAEIEKVTKALKYCWNEK